MTKVLIGIQARSTSHRLPGKALIQLYNKPVLSWVLNACTDSQEYINKRADGNIEVEVAILCPIGDKLTKHYKNVPIVEGDEWDVLSRYTQAQTIFEPDYICRITGDCPFLTGFLITNHIFKAVNNGYDYVSNVDPEIRTELDGRDVEVLSRKAMKWLKANAKTHEDKEHVTIKITKEKPKELKRAHFLNRLDVSDVKLSVDTEKDLHNASKRMASFLAKKAIAEKDVGANNIFYC